jgi:hypothetical protein
MARAFLAALRTAIPDLQQPSEDPPWLDIAREIWSFLEPYKYFLLVLIVFWIIARRSGRPEENLTQQAQRVLEEKYRKGEISQKAYEKYRQDISLKPRR